MKGFLGFSFVILTTTLTAQAVQDVSTPQIVQTSQNELSTLSVGKNGTPSSAVQKREERMALTRIALFSSGIGFFEHKGELSDAVEIALPFNVDLMDDALKSLIINDPLSKDPQVVYPSKETLFRTLKSLSIDLSGNPGMAEVLGNLRGAEVDVYAPNLISGRIIGVEYRTVRTGNNQTDTVLFVSLLSKQGVKTIALSDISAFSFKDEKINADLNHALDLLLESRNSDTRALTVRLSGKGKRNVTLSYVIPAPVWKVSYRLDLSEEKPLLQGWAIVDNDSDTDWENVELSLVAGRPTSFIQRLYAPYRVSRPILPLSIAGAADAPIYGSGWEGISGAQIAAKRLNQERADTTAAYGEEAYEKSAEAPLSAPRASFASGVVETADAQKAGDQFQFTIKKPVSLARQQSAMLPLVESTIEAEKVLVFSGAKATPGRTVNPSIGARLVNTSGMKLPAGPITVFDAEYAGYAGDALIEFFPENEKRLISFGDDLSVQGSVISTNSYETVSVKASKGVMIINRRQVYEKVYTIKNAADETKNLVIEHSVMPGTTLVEPSKFDERTDAVYRFSTELPASGTILFTVKESDPVAERIVLGQSRIETIAVYASNQEIPENARQALQKAVSLKRFADDARAAQADAEVDLVRLFAEQERVRQNLIAAGAQSPQGQDYLKKLTDLDAAIDKQNESIADAKSTALTAQNAYADYLVEMEL
ncbi:MAG: DUF4139 domain-containing protein [Treponema sp.]|nr:DUF4139 domain-containing protein [Treponema sp.]